MCRFYWLSYGIVYGLLLTLVGAIHAHDPGLSAVAIELSDHEVAARLTFSQPEFEALVLMDVNHNNVVSPEELISARPRLMSLASDLIEIESDGQRLTTRDIQVQLDASGALQFNLTFPWQAGSKLRVASPLLAKLARGHRQYVTMQDGSGVPVANHMLDADRSAFEMSLAHVEMAKSVRPFGQFLRLGVDHIVMGYDHLLFLVGLLIAVTRFQSAARIITSFTIAHSITLALATFNVVELPPRVVEPLIAVSIIYVGLENVFRRHQRHREWLTFGFGLVHGLGFASVLRELAVGTAVGGFIIPLLAFNVGVELGLIGIALLCLPLLGNVQNLPRFFPRFVTAGSILVTLAGTYWLVERTIWS